MKYIILVFAIFTLFLACKHYEKEETANKVGVTREEVIAIAAKYGLQDSIAAGYVSPHFKPFPPEAYPGLTPEFWDSYFAYWQKFSIQEKEMQGFRSELPTVTSMADYYRLIEKYPKVYQEKIKLYGGIEAYNQRKERHLSSAMHIYLDSKGALVFIPADADDGNYPGKRLDNSKP